MNHGETPHRGTFSSRYFIRKSERHPKSTCRRLGDYVLAIREPHEPEYFEDALSGEVCVLDLATRQKAWIETPDVMTLPEIARMIEGHFSATTFRVSNRLWVVPC